MLGLTVPVDDARVLSFSLNTLNVQVPMLSFVVIAQGRRYFIGGSDEARNKRS